MKWAINYALLASRSANSWALLTVGVVCRANRTQHIGQFAVIRLNANDLVLRYFGDTHRFSFLAVHIPAEFQIVRQHQVAVLQVTL